MSRSRHHGCGRGCGVCGDDSEVRRAREDGALKIDFKEYISEFDTNKQIFCADCNKKLSNEEYEHHLEGFGHQFRCCDCYNRHLGKPD